MYRNHYTFVPPIDGYHSYIFSSQIYNLSHDICDASHYHFLFYSAVSCCWLHRKFLKSDQVKRYKSPCSFSRVLQVPFALEHKHCLVYEQLEKMDNLNYQKREVCRLSWMNSSFRFIFFVLFLSSRLPFHSITDHSWWISAEKNDNIKMLVKAYRIESIGQSITILHTKMYC